jgi:hypothetical protein
MLWTCSRDGHSGTLKGTGIGSINAGRPSCGSGWLEVTVGPYWLLAPNGSADGNEFDAEGRLASQMHIYGIICSVGILHQQLGLLGRLPAGLALERPVWSSHCLDTWLLLRLRSCTRTALAQGWTDGRARVARDGRASRDVSWTVHVPTFESSHCQWSDIR